MGGIIIYLFEGRNTRQSDEVLRVIPQEVVAEGIVNAVVHRDYTSNGSVQVMLFKDRLEVWNRHAAANPDP